MIFYPVEMIIMCFDKYFAYFHAIFSFSDWAIFSNIYC